ncbi:MAG: aminopeptidase [Deltaproteobacteria bacterium]|nr:aminopeptidase [Deltaproteobacteria bacterium]
MLTEKQIEKYADVLLWALYTARKKRYMKNDIIMIRYDYAALKVAEALQARILDRGMNPVPRGGLSPSMEKNFYDRAGEKQLVFQPPGDREFYRVLHGAVYLNGPESLTHLVEVDPKKIGKAAVARKPLRDILDRREEKGRFGWTLCLFPTPEPAKTAGLTMDQYEKQVVKACYLDREDPVAEWKEIHRRAKDIKSRLNRLKVESLHVESKSTDLVVTPGVKRRWVGMTGHNIPSFEIFLSPDWRGTEGVYFADQPSFRSGNRVEGVKLHFEKGSVFKMEAEKGEAFLKKQVNLDQGAGRVGEFSLTDRRFSRIDRFMASTLYDENYGGPYGNCHLALGSSYSETFDGDPAGLNKKIKERLGLNDSAIHWDLVNTEEKRVTARLESGKKLILYENGKFTL